MQIEELDLNHLPDQTDASSDVSVDTTLRLCTGSHDPDEDNIDTTLRLFTEPCDFLGVTIAPPRNNTDGDINLGSHGVSTNSQTPLQSNHLTSGSTCTTTDEGSSASTSNNAVGRRRPRRNRPGDEAGPEPDLPCPQLVGRIGPETRPVFLYRKRLEVSDTKQHHNRLLVNNKAKLMGFMREEERQAVNSEGNNPGMDVAAIDSMGRDFMLQCKSWPSVGRVALKKSWYKMIAANEATVGQMVHVWGFRKEDGVFRLAFEFP